ncbi:bifunctional 4-hydroxy-2-oxoglutarate aldolase/2-dehydro-3-deoxy-phosphogluconate aldolase [Paenibacillus sp.]|uniref:bifunctional 4-hydroxy-2-oxoglutarate aldolase/2-dehydro-3-deoxy-phosphogluconate aldolase n=1 Tax=Paenibacillus sp. TaxID=58172 RepID=UPI002D434EC5|nr:bifunctional 4-hydroxy-2-oxoglutarate aldolase/2-dehydro-3-deoxy-phosphogluconate aldolase [Paenibacillus sp.]HZG85928.1 bifunctional 4-hydroxy-2-oxoglutarate aldolase/2-dehydro-3-deoxy-phosphogluconate aldolase [Paenibacillus sp.]
MDERQVKELIDRHRIIAIVRGVDAAHIIPTVQALYDGGIRLAEVTIDHDRDDAVGRTAAKIRAIRDAFGDEMCVGAGTVLTEQQVTAMVEAGAQYMISPHADGNVIRRTKALGKVSIPGALTPTEAVAAHTAGADYVKLFPAGEIGIAYIKALMAPLRHIPMLAVGGVTADNVKTFLQAGLAGVGVGGSLVSPTSIEAGAFDRIAAAAKQFVHSINN